MNTTDNIILPDANGDEGVETRILLAECRGPAYPSYDAASALECMQLMDAVLWNRMKNPGPFLARNAKSLADVVKARGQFAGFENYPNIETSIKSRIDGMLSIANNLEDPRSSAFSTHIAAAISISKSSAYTDPSPGTLTAWRTVNSGSPGKGFLKYKTLCGVDFYYSTAG